MITLPGGDSIRLGAAASPARSSERGRTGGGEAAGLNYPLFQALGADFAVALAQAADTTVVTLHDVAAGGVRREVKKRLPPLTSPDFRLAVHRLADQVLQASLGAPGVAATRLLYVMDGKVWRLDQAGADKKLVSSSDRQAMSPAWAADGRRFAYMEFWAGHGQLFVQDMATEKRAAVVTTGAAPEFTPASPPHGKRRAVTPAYSAAAAVQPVNLKDNCCLQRLTVGRS